MSKKEKVKKQIKQPSFGLSLGIFVGIMAILCLGLLVVGVPLTTLLFLSWIVMFLVGFILNYSFDKMETFIYDMIRRVLQPAVILLCVGALVGSWCASGTIAYIIYHCLAWLTPGLFLVITLLACSVTSLFTGTSWGTIGTMGVALIAVAQSMGLNLGLSAGAIICGAFFGDKLSPLSDTTNIAPAMAGGKVMNHVKHQLWTTLPAYLITMVILAVLGLSSGSETYNTEQVALVMDTVENSFNLGFVTLLPAIVVLVLLFMSKPPVWSIMLGAIAGVVVAIFYQGTDLLVTLDYMMNGFVSETGETFVDSLLSRGGVSSMWSTIAIIFFACGLGGMLNDFGILNAILDPLAEKMTTPAKAIIMTMGVGYASNAIGSSNLAQVITGTVMQPIFRKLRLRPENLSRTIEDCVTMSCFLIPWNTGAVYAAGALGIAATTFAPYCFLGYIVPIFTLIYAFTGLSITKLDDGEEYGKTDKYTWRNKKMPKEAE